MEPLTTSAGRKRVLSGYAVAAVASIGLYALIRHFGERLAPGVEASERVADSLSTHGSILAQVLLALAVITFLARLVGGVFNRYLHQPPVIGEIVAGLMLGPSLLKIVSPSAFAFLLPAEAAPFLSIIAKIGVVLFMFLVGLELDLKALKKSSHTTLAISHASIAVPFLLGSTLALALYPRYAEGHVTFTAFSLFLGISMSVTAFPVLARILTDRAIQNTPLGMTALACAAIDDVTAWTLLAFVVGIVSAQVESAAMTLLYVVAYIAVMWVVVRPIMRRLIARVDTRSTAVTRSAISLVFVGLLLSAYVTESIGIHALFGAFLFGAFMPHEGKLAEHIRTGTADVVVVMFLPAFFAFTGMRTEVGLLDSGVEWLAFAGITLVATLGKFGGSALAGRCVGLSWRDASAIGLLMNTRGLMELIVLNLGLDLGVISPTVFAMMVLMALATTFMASPLLDLLTGRSHTRTIPATTG